MAERLEDLNIPNAVVTRIIKENLPESVNIGKDSRTALGKAASVFVLYLTAAATNVSKQHNRKILSGSDVLEALADIEMDNFVDPLSQSIEAYKRFQREKKEAHAKRRSENSIQNGDKEDDGEETEEVDD